MKYIDYTNYTLEQLLECQENIDKTKFPENSLALENELASRDYEENSAPEMTVEDELIEFKIAEKRVQIIGYLQLLGAAVILYYLVVGSNYSTTTISIASFIIVLNIVAGYTAVREMYSWYWLSILNQGFQIVSINVGTYIINYSSIGGVYLKIYWGSAGSSSSAGINFSANLNPGFVFTQLTENLSMNTIYFDVLASVFIIALATVKDKKLSPENN